MLNNEKNFYKCLGFKTDKKLNKPLFFYHVPKCAGTTFCVIISHLFKKSHRLQGPLFPNNDKGGTIAYNNFLKQKDLIENSNINFIYGHVPFEINETINKRYFFSTLIREPIQRCISHYTWGINKGYYSVDEKIENLFKSNRLPNNLIVNQFSGQGLTDSNVNNSLDLALNNLTNKIDFLFDISDIYELLNLIISIFDLPNIFFQKQQVQTNKIQVSSKNIEIIKKYNEKDILLYSELERKKLIKNYKNHIFEKRNNNIYLYSSPSIYVNKKKTLLLNEVKIKNIEKNLINLGYEIFSV